MLGSGYFVLYGLLVHWTVINTKSVRSILLLHKKNTTTPRRRTRPDETHFFFNIELLLQLLQLFRSELVRTFAHRFRARLKIDDEFDWPVRRHSWKLFWKDVLIFANDWNLRDGIQFTLLIERK